MKRLERRHMTKKNAQSLIIESRGKNKNRRLKVMKSLKGGPNPKIKSNVSIVEKRDI